MILAFLLISILSVGFAALSNSHVIAGSTVFSIIKPDCMNKLEPEETNPGTVLKKCNKQTSTTPSPGSRKIIGGKTLQSKETESVTFKCEVYGMGMNDTFRWQGPPRGGSNAQQFLYWKKGNDTSGVSVTMDKRFRFTYQNTTWDMRLTDIRRSDEGEYYCIVETRGGTTITARFQLNVNYPVSIKNILPNEPPFVREESNVIYFNESTNAMIVCETSGKPTPTTWWILPNSSSSLSPSPGNNFTFINITKEDAGVYTCESRQVELVASLDVSVVVLHAPITVPEKAVIRAGIGSSVQLTCNYLSPVFEVTTEWTRGYEILRGSETMSINRYTDSYEIGTIKPERDYTSAVTCIVTNALGSNRCVFEITGRPRKPVIVSSRNGEWRRKYNLEWRYTTEDAATITHFMIFYTRIVNTPRDNMLFEKVNLVKTSRPNHLNATLRDLQPNKTYHVELYAVNDYGSGEITIFSFKTPEDNLMPDIPNPAENLAQSNSDNNNNSAGYLGPSKCMLYLSGILCIMFMRL